MDHEIVELRMGEVAVSLAVTRGSVRSGRAWGPRESLERFVCEVAQAVSGFYDPEQHTERELAGALMRVRAAVARVDQS